MRVSNGNLRTWLMGGWWGVLGHAASRRKVPAGPATAQLVKEVTTYPVGSRDTWDFQFSPVGFFVRTVLPTLSL